MVGLKGSAAGARARRGVRWCGRSGRARTAWQASRASWSTWHLNGSSGSTANSTRSARSSPIERSPTPIVLTSAEHAAIGAAARVPVAVKDEIDIAGEVTSRGTGAITARATADAEVVRRLRDAGAIVVGKTTMPELGLWPFTESITWGVTRNPWDVERTPGGSSGGSAAAVAAGLVPAAIGVDGAGSIRIPAACCGVFGLKPQSGRVPRTPHDGDGNHWICFGPLTRSVLDSAIVLDAIQGPTATRDTPGRFEGAARARPPRLRVAVCDAFPAGTRGTLSPDVRAALARYRRPAALDGPRGGRTRHRLPCARQPRDPRPHVPRDPRLRAGDRTACSASSAAPAR